MPTLPHALDRGRAAPTDWRAALRGHMPFDRRAAGTYRLLAIQAVLTAMLAVALGFGYRSEGINEVFWVFGGVIAIAAVMRWRGIARLAAAGEAAVLVTLASMAAAFLCVLLSAAGFAYRDPLLAGADRLLFPFFDWVAMARALAGQRALTTWMCTIYTSLLWQPYLLAVVLGLMGRHDQLWRFVRAWTLALVVTVALFGLMPAVTPYVYYGFTPADLPHLTVNAGWRPAEIIGQLRSGALRELASGSMAGLVTFPSFHTAGAVLLAWGFRGVPLLGRAFLALNCVMILTVPLIGSHYFVDVLGGIAVAALAIRASRGRRAAAA